MKIHMYALAFCLAGFAACGDDDGNGNPADGGGDTSVQQEAGPEEAGTEEAGTEEAGTEEAGTQEAGTDGYYTGDPDQCVGQEYDGESAATEAGKAAAGSCLAVPEDQDYRHCVRDAVVDNVDGIDDACGYCYGVSANCARDNCIAQCAANPSSEACLSCRCDNGCYQAFDECSGTTTSFADNCEE